MAEENRNSYCIVLCCVVLCCVVLCCVVLCCVVLCCVVLCCVVLCCVVLYCIVLYCIVLYCIVLYCIVLYCIVNVSFLRAATDVSQGGRGLLGVRPGGFADLRTRPHTRAHAFLKSPEVIILE